MGESSKYLMMIVTGLVNLLKPVAHPTSSSSQVDRGGKGTSSGPAVAVSSCIVDEVEEEEEDVMSDLDTEGEEGGEPEDKRLVSNSGRILLPSVRQRPKSGYGVVHSTPTPLARPHTAASRGRPSGAVKIPPQPQSRKELDESIRKLHQKMIRKERKVEQVKK